MRPSSRRFEYDFPYSDEMSGRRDFKKLCLVGAGPLETAGHLIAFANLLVDDKVQIRKRCSHGTKDFFQAFKPGPLPRERRLLDDVFADKLCRCVGLSLVDHFFNEATNDCGRCLAPLNSPPASMCFSTGTDIQKDRNSQSVLAEKPAPGPPRQQVYPGPENNRSGCRVGSSAIKGIARAANVRFGAGRGQSEKEITCAMERSQPAAHEHVEHTYRHFAVNSRAQLSAYFCAAAQCPISPGARRCLRQQSGWR